MLANAHLASAYPAPGRTFPRPAALQVAQPLLAVLLRSLFCAPFAPAAFWRIAPPFRAASCFSTSAPLVRPGTPSSSFFSSTYDCELKTDHSLSPHADHSGHPLSPFFSSTYYCKLRTDHFLSPATPLESTHTVSVCKHIHYNLFRITTYTHSIR